MISEAIQGLIDTSELSRGLKACLCYDLTEFVDLVASQDVRHLKHFATIDFASIVQETQCTDCNIFETFVKHPDPLLPEEAEDTLMHLLTHSGIANPVWKLSTSMFFDDDDPAPGYTCISLALRVARYSLHRGNVTIPAKALNYPPNLAQLDRKVWEDISAAAAAVIVGQTVHDAGNSVYCGGQATFRTARMDAVMILLAESPYPSPFPRSICYTALGHYTSLIMGHDLTISMTSYAFEGLEQQRMRRLAEGIVLYGDSIVDDAERVLAERSQRRGEKVWLLLHDTQDDEVEAGNWCK